MPITADSRLALTEFLLGSEDVAACAQYGLEWLGTHAGVTRALCAASVGGDSQLWGVAGIGISPARTGAFQIDLAKGRDRLSRAARDCRPVWFGPGRSRPDTPLGSRPFHAIPMRLGRQRPALGLLLVEGTSERPDRTLTWFVRVLSAKLGRLRSRHAFSDRGLDRERRLLFSVINAVSDPILLTDQQGKLLMGNTRAEQLLSWSEDTSAGRRHAIELNNLHFSSALAGASVDGGFSAREVILVDPDDGSDLLFELLTTPLEAERGQSAFVSVLRNVTDLGRATREIEDNYKRLRAAEAQARAERRRIEQVIHSVVDPIIVSNAAGKILMTNRPAELLFAPADHAPQALRGAHANVARFSSFVGLLMSGSADRVRERLTLTDPQTDRAIPMEAVAASVPAGRSELASVVTVLHDLTEAVERERLYAELKLASGQLEARVSAATTELATQNELLRRQALALEHASAAKSRFLASISHEFRTPLNAILGYTWMLLQNMGGTLNPEHRRMVSKVDSNSRNLAALINNVLDISRIEADQIVVELTTFAVEPLVREVLDELETVINASSVPVLCQVSDELPPLRSDRQKVKQVLVNLLSNALKFTATGTIRIEATVEAAPGPWRIAVHDTGSGIAVSDRERIFEAFEQAGPTGRVSAGTGLGLAISRRLARLLGGDVNVDSTPGMGSTFVLSLPLEPQRLIMPDVTERATGRALAGVGAANDGAQS
ncbi:MAG TPA: ATP-binding protein [Vicinamibacterales bacterium]|nr:ATP-binding protein [Vicinamibacterales bacterium]